MIQNPPIMVDPMGSHWRQPGRYEVLIDDISAVMSRRSLDQLMDYTHTVPTGVYVGKMWKCKHDGVWFLRWYGPSEEADMCSINTRRILLLEDR